MAEPLRRALHLLLVVAVVGACGGDGGGSPDASTGADATTGFDAPSAPDAPIPVDAGPPDATPCPCAFENGSGHCDATGLCIVDGCDALFDDCDLDPTTGCETPLDTLTDCNGCGLACAFDNASASCPGGVCTFGGCLAPFDDCDMDPMTGCEVDLSSTATDCNGCGLACDFGPNTVSSCAGGMCQNDGCAVGFADCNGDMTDGCEHDEVGGGPCVCMPGVTQSCYTGAPPTLGVGACAAGMQTCDPSGIAWGPCVGEVTPQPEVCTNGADENCDGIVDNVPDVDGDGWTACNGDCCEATGDCGGLNPVRVNPGAFEALANGVDDDCDAATSDVTAAAACSSVADFSAVTATNVAQGIDLCQTTTVAPPLPLKKWGLITATHLLATGATPSAAQLSIMQSSQSALLVNYGTGGIVPSKNATMAGLSTGLMRDQLDPGYVAPNAGTNHALASVPPAVYLAAHGGSLPSSSGCSGVCPSGSGAYDPVNVRLTIRVPTNAASFSYDYRFFSAEYWTYSCTVYNDFHLALLTTTAPGIPADKNIAFDAFGNAMSVNNGFVDICVPMGCHTCPLGSAPLAGTGMEVGNTGAGTNWLTVTAPVVPGETITLDLMIFDVSDGSFDSNLLLDNFRWNLLP